MKTNFRILLRPRPLWLLLGLVSLMLMVTSAAGSSLHFAYKGGAFEVNPASLEVSLLRPGKPAHILSGAAFNNTGKVSELTAEGWTISRGSSELRVRVKVVEDALRVSIQASQPQTLRWPRLQSNVLAYAMPLGEGSYIPGNDPKWLNWLLKRYTGEPLQSALSMPFWTQLHKDSSITWIVETPFDTQFDIKQINSTPIPQLLHTFNRLAPEAPFVVRIVPGPADPLYGARLYRQWLKDNGHFTSLTEKIRALPQVARLGGAPHIYLWDAGPLKVADVLDWPGFVTSFEQARANKGHLAAHLWASFDRATRKVFALALSSTGSASGQVTPYSRQALIRAINQGLRQAITVRAQAPLSGNHDPAAEVLWGKAVRESMTSAFGPYLASPERWGGGLSVDTVNALQKAGLTRAWLGANDWLDAFWHPQAVAQAKAAGYLVAVYDNYGDAHRPDEPETWAAAQMGSALANAGHLDAQGNISKGFNDIGVFASAKAAQPYAQQRITAVARAAGLNSYFLDVDAAAPALPDYTPGRETSEAESAQMIRRRLDFPSKALKLVTGSEGGLAFYTPNIAYSHGIATQPFDWLDPDMAVNQQSPFYLGQYWPPETPSLFFKSVPLKPQLAPFVRSYRYRLPLYQMVLHDSLVTTHH